MMPFWGQAALALTIAAMWLVGWVGCWVGHLPGNDFATSHLEHAVVLNIQGAFDAIASSGEHCVVYITPASSCA